MGIDTVNLFDNLLLSLCTIWCKFDTMPMYYFCAV